MSSTKEKIHQIGKKKSHATKKVNTLKVKTTPSKEKTTKNSLVHLPPQAGMENDQKKDFTSAG